MEFFEGLVAFMFLFWVIWGHYLVIIIFDNIVSKLAPGLARHIVPRKHGDGGADGVYWHRILFWVLCIIWLLLPVWVYQW